MIIQCISALLWFFEGFGWPFAFDGQPHFKRPAHGNIPLVAPKLIEAFRRQLGIEGCVLDAGMSHVALDGSGVLPLIRQIKARAVS